MFAAFRLMNSWGTDWGDQGFLWVSYRAMSALTSEAYAVVADPSPKREPEPKPAPVVVEPPKPAPVVVEPPKPHPLPLQPPLAEAATKLRHLADGLKCAKVETRAKDGFLTVGGFVATEQDRDTLAAALGEGGAGWKPRLDLAVEPWPHCEARLTLAAALAQPAGLSASVKGGSILKEGDGLSLEITTPDYPSHLYVSYIQADGQVAHLRRYVEAGWKPVPPKTRLTLGGPEWKVSGPTFGRESLVVVASPLPLLALDRPPSENEREYLTEFRLGLLAQKPGKGRHAASAVLIPVTTTAK